MDNSSTKRNAQYPPLTPEEQAEISNRYIAEMREFQSSMEVTHRLGEPALRRLLELCESRNSGQIHKVARLLAGLYNGCAFPFDLTNLRCLDSSILNDCISVIRMDACPKKEVHRYFENGDDRWQKLITKFRITPIKHRQYFGFCFKR